MNAAIAIPLPLAHVGSVNAWLLLGDPVTLIDTGPRDDGALSALEAGLRREGLRVEDIELLLATHHHLDHVGLAATIQRRSGARVAVLDRVADYAARYSAEIEEDRRFARALMAHHGVPGPGRRRHRGVLGLHPRHDRALPRRRAAGRRRPGPRGRPRACGSSRVPVTARRTRCSSTSATRSRSSATTSWRRSPRTRRSARPIARRTAVRARACAISRASSAPRRCRSPGS